MPDRGANKTKEAIVISQAPDVCKTPIGNSVVPIPYPIIAKFDEAENTSPNVNFQGNPVFHYGSYLPKVTGNEAGTVGGIKSGVNRGIVNPLNKSSTLRINKEWAIRHADGMHMNCSAPKAQGNTTGKVLYIYITTETYVDPKTGEITHIEKAEVRDEDGLKAYGEQKVITDAEGNVIENEFKEAYYDADGNTVTTYASVDADGNEKFDQITTFPTDGEFKLLAEDNVELNELPLFDDKGLNNEEFLPYGPGDDHHPDYDPSKFGSGIEPIELPAQPPDPLAQPLEIPDDHPDLLKDPEYQEALRLEEEANGFLDGLNEEKAWEIAETAADIAGIIDPTPISDSAAMGMSARRGDWLGVGLGLVSYVPWVGDAIAKPIKGTRAARRMIVLTTKITKASAKAKKALRAKQKALKEAKERLAARLKKKKAEAEPPPKPKGKDGANVKYKAKGPKCFNKPDGVSDAEFDRQLKEQQDAINNMTGQTMLDRRKAIADAGGTKSLRDPNAQIKARTDYKEARELQLSRQDLSDIEIKNVLSKEMKDLDATHSLDMIAGGDPSDISGLGNKKVNRSMGSQWRGARSQALEDLAKEMKTNGAGGKKMEVKLKRCK